MYLLSNCYMFSLPLYDIGYKIQEDVRKIIVLGHWFYDLGAWPVKTDIVWHFQIAE